MTKRADVPSIYFDANPFIYFVEGDERSARCLRPLFDLLSRTSGMATTSELTLAEVLPKVRPDARRSYFNLIVWSKLFHLRPVTREILIDTAKYRRTVMRTLSNRLTAMPKLPDAIHVVTAVRSGCRVFLSADNGLKVPSGMSVLGPDESGIASLLQSLA